MLEIDRRDLVEGPKRASSALAASRGAEAARIMTMATPASAARRAPRPDDAPVYWPDELWAGLVGRADAMIRTCYGVYEFTDDPDCVLRVGLGRARAPLALHNGTAIEPGELIGILHFWNEHLPRYSPHGPDLGWACAMRGKVRHSLRALALHIGTEPAWREVRALRGDAALSTRLGGAQIARLVGHYGFERVPASVSWFGRLHAFGDSFVLWGLTRAFNPSALPRHGFLRDHCELWISREALLRRYCAGG
ncbi:MAG: YkoP family protein [Stellaceae bacterium]